MDLTECVTQKEAAGILQVSPVTVYRWTKAGKLPAEPIGQVTVLARRDVEALAQRRRGLGEEYDAD